MPSNDPITSLLERYKTIHMVGLSSNPERDSNEVARYLQSKGYRVIPINPRETEVLGERAYPSLTAAAEVEPVTFIDVFRRGDAIGELIDEAVALGTVEVVWLQLGVRNKRAEEAVVAAGITLVADRCMKVEHTARFG